MTAAGVILAISNIFQSTKVTQVLFHRVRVKVTLICSDLNLYFIPFTTFFNTKCNLQQDWDKNIYFMRGL